MLYFKRRKHELDVRLFKLQDTMHWRRIAARRVPLVPLIPAAHNKRGASKPLRPLQHLRQGGRVPSVLRRVLDGRDARHAIRPLEQEDRHVSRLHPRRPQRAVHAGPEQPQLRRMEGLVRRQRRQRHRRLLRARLHRRRAASLRPLWPGALAAALAAMILYRAGGGEGTR